MKPISKEAEAALFKDLQDGNEEAFTQICNQYQPLAMNLLREFVGTEFKHLQPDLRSDSRFILWNAAKNFDLTKGNRFSSYLRKCVLNEIWRNIKAGHKENEKIERYWHEIPDGSFKDVNSDGECEVTLTDSFPCRDESIIAALTPFCKGDKQKRLLEVICTDENIWYKNGRVNYTAVGRRLGTSGEAVRQMISKLGADKNLKSAICELVPR